jgi:RimJ/RimL family protein N-acetyltransferase
MIDRHNRPVLGDETIKLRAPVATDVDERHALGTTPEILRMFDVVADPDATFTRAMAGFWVDQQLQELLAFIFEYKDRLIGGLRLHSHVEHDRRASLAIALLDGSQLGKGIGTLAMRLILDHAFGSMGANRVALRVIDYNARAIAAYEKLAFKIEGRERQAARVGETFHDDLMVALLASEWTA